MAGTAFRPAAEHDVGPLRAFMAAPHDEDGATPPAGSGE